MSATAEGFPEPFILDTPGAYLDPPSALLFGNRKLLAKLRLSRRCIRFVPHNSSPPLADSMHRLRSTSSEVKVVTAHTHKKEHNCIYLGRHRRICRQRRREREREREIYIYIYIYMQRKQTHAHTHTRTRTHKTHRHTDTHTHTDTRRHTDIDTHTHTHKHTHTHTNTRTHMQVHASIFCTHRDAARERERDRWIDRWIDT